jgi:hypothetical protein
MIRRAGFGRFVFVLAAALLAGCALPAAPDPAPASSVESGDPDDARSTVQAPAGFDVEILFEGLVGPTQMIAGPEGELWVAHLNGGENAGAGQVLAIDPAGGVRRVLLENLLKPTGIAYVPGTGEGAEAALWVQMRRELWRAPLRQEDAGWVAGTPTPVLTNMPYNGRSNGSLTVTPWGTLLYETSGSQVGGTVAPGSATLWELDPAGWQAPAPRVVATGLKGAYAHAVDNAGRLWIGELGDDPVNGGAPPDELNVMAAPAPGVDGGAPPDFGWPACFGIRQPATNLGGTPERCAATVAPALLFAPRASPVSVAMAPWSPETVLVALWVQNEVVAVEAGDLDVAALTGAGPAAPVAGSENSAATATPFLTAIVNPQSLLPWNDGSLLVAEFAAGRIHRVAPSQP